MPLSDADSARALDTCDCIPGFHEAKDTTCRIDALGRIRVQHPSVVCAPNASASTYDSLGVLRGCQRKDRVHAGVGANFHRCWRLTNHQCACCDCIDGAPHPCQPGTRRDATRSASSS